MPQLTGRQLIPDEWLVIAVVSLSINACTLLRGLVSRVVRYAGGPRSRLCGCWPKVTDCESAIGRQSTRTTRRDDLLTYA